MVARLRCGNLSKSGPAIRGCGPGEIMTLPSLPTCTFKSPPSPRGTAPTSSLLQVKVLGTTSKNVVIKNQSSVASETSCFIFTIAACLPHHQTSARFAAVEHQLLTTSLADTPFTAVPHIQYFTH